MTQIADIEALIAKKRAELTKKAQELIKKGEDEDSINLALKKFDQSSENLLDGARAYDPDPKVESINRRSQLGKTASPFDPRFPNQNQTKHCYQSYVDYYRCINLRGEDFKPCQYFLKTFRTLCLTDWIEAWDEQRANGTFPSKLE